MQFDITVHGWSMPLKIHETAERRQVTILHCDIVNSTEVIDSLDAEDVLSIMENYLDGWMEIVGEFRGTFVGYTGDGFQAYFGYPFAHEDAAVDALSAALEVTRMFAEQDSRIGQKLECRMGIATGQVVIAQAGMHQIARSLVAFGSAPCLATRLEQAAVPGHILVDGTTLKLASSQFVFREVGQVPAKGFRHDIEAWEVVRKRRPGPRFDASRLSPYVGRSRELAFLSSLWQSVTLGKGQVAVLLGEPGIGKSRLAFELEQSIAGSVSKSYRFQCSSLHLSTPLHPWFHWVMRVADIRQNDDAKTSNTKLHDCLCNKLGFSDEAVRTSEMIISGTPASSRAKGPQLSQKMLLRFQKTLVEHLIKMAAHDPIFVLVEDIQWMDASTQAMIELLIERASNKSILLVLTGRPENAPSFDLPHVTVLPLTSLDGEAVAELVSAFMPDGRPSADQTALMSTIEKCDGNPLFVEEFSKHYLEHATPVTLASSRKSAADDVPLLLQGSLLERIDTAGKGKGIAQLASVIGTEFDRDILIELSDDEAENVQTYLDQLNDLNILSRNRINDRVTYSFRHVLLRDAVYSSLLHAARAGIHRRVATLLARERQTYSAEVIARHFEEGGERVSAFHYWLEAGQHALQSGATKEAVNLLASADRLAEGLEETPQNLKGLADMYLAYGHATNASLGAAAEPIKYYRKAEEFATRLDNTGLILESLDWQFGVQFNAGELSACREPALKLKQLGLSLGDREAMVSGFQGLGMTHFMQGEFVPARHEFEKGLESAGEYVSGEHCFPSMTLSYLAWTYFVLGQRAEAVSCADRAIASARRESAHAVATALSNCCYVYQCLGATDKVYTCTDELLEHTRKHGELMYLKRGNIFRSWADFVSGHEDGAIDEIKGHIDFLLDSGEEIEMTYFLGLLADLQIRQHCYADAMRSLDKALKLAAKNQENFYLSELHRLTAHALESGGQSNGDVAEHLAKAEQTANAQQARAWLDQLPRKAAETVT